MTVPYPLRFEDLVASYAGNEIFRDASLALETGVYALQGSNGSGKTTLLRLLAGAQPPDSGRIWIDGMALADAPQAARGRLSYVPDESPVYPFITGREFLRFVAAAKHARLEPDAMRLVAGLGAAPYLDARFDAMSLGTQKKFLLSAAWIGEPRVMLMDEPSNALDAAAREALIAELRAKGAQTTVFCATHDADFVAGTGAAIVTIDDICRRN